MTQPTAQQLLQAASDEMQQGNITAGEQLLEKFFLLQPNYAPALDLAARAHLAMGKVDLALARAKQAVTQEPAHPFVLTFAEALKAKGDTQTAAKYFQKVLEKVPSEIRALQGLGEIYEQAGYRRLAIKSYQALLALKPEALDVAIKYSNLLPIPELTNGMDALLRARPGPEAKIQQRMGYLSHTVVYKEWAERARRGLMPYHATQLDEMFFTFSAADRDEYERLAGEVLVVKPNDKSATSAMACTLFSRGKRVESEPFFHRIGINKPDSIYDNINFQPAFYAALEAMSDADLRRNVPPVTELAPAVFTKPDVIYLSCNYSYFVDFARTMLLSIDAKAAGAQVHLHIMDGEDADWVTAKDFCARLKNIQIALTAERPGVDKIGLMAARSYYHAIRFIRLYDHLKHYRKTLWLMDVDALMHQDPAPMFAKMGAADAAFRARPGRWEPWNQFNASVMSIAPTPGGLAYLRLIAAYIAHYHNAGALRWGIDQLAMYAVHEHLRDKGQAPSLHLLDDRAVDYECFDDSYVWCNSGRGKFLQLKQLQKGAESSIDPDRAKYFDALKVFVTQLN